MKFIKVFADDTSYKAYRDGKSYEMPNVSLSRGNNTRKVYYNVDANGHKYVDLGLPSGTLWATCNVGASKESEAGLYFQWGDTSGYTASQVGLVNDKKFFGWSDYKWSIEGSSSNFRKYTTKGDMLELEDDAAHVNMGGDWHMPTPAQFKEFTDNTTTAWTASNGVSGVTFTSTTNGKSIFIPAAGIAYNGLVDQNGNWGGIWAPMLGSVQTGSGLVLGSNESSIGADTTSNLSNRSNGCSVRGVIG